MDYINSCCQELFEGKVACELSPSHWALVSAQFVWQGKGRILRACRAFKQGDLLFEEPPLHIVVADKDHEAFLQVQKVCEKHQAGA